MPEDNHTASSSGQVPRRARPLETVQHNLDFDDKARDKTAKIPRDDLEMPITDAATNDEAGDDFDDKARDKTAKITRDDLEMSITDAATNDEAGDDFEADADVEADVDVANPTGYVATPVPKPPADSSTQPPAEDLQDQMIPPKGIPPPPGRPESEEKEKEQVCKPLFNDTDTGDVASEADRRSLTAQRTLGIKDKCTLGIIYSKLQDFFRPRDFGTLLEKCDRLWTMWWLDRSKSLKSTGSLKDYEVKLAHTNECFKTVLPSPDPHDVLEIHDKSTVPEPQSVVEKTIIGPENVIDGQHRPEQLEHINDSTLKEFSGLQHTRYAHNAYGPACKSLDSQICEPDQTSIKEAEEIQNNAQKNIDAIVAMTSTHKEAASIETQVLTDPSKSNAYTLGAQDKLEKSYFKANKEVTKIVNDVEINVQKAAEDTKLATKENKKNMMDFLKRSSQTHQLVYISVLLEQVIRFSRTDIMTHFVGQHNSSWSELASDHDELQACAIKQHNAIKNSADATAKCRSKEADAEAIQKYSLPAEAFAVTLTGLQAELLILKDTEKTAEEVCLNATKEYEMLNGKRIATVNELSAACDARTECVFLIYEFLGTLQTLWAEVDKSLLEEYQTFKECCTSSVALEQCVSHEKVMRCYLTTAEKQFQVLKAQKPNFKALELERKKNEKELKKSSCCGR